MKTKEKIIEEQRYKAFDKVAKSICNYMKSNGWNIIVIGEPKVLKHIGELKYNYTLEFHFTGKPI